MGFNSIIKFVAFYLVHLIHILTLLLKEKRAKPVDKKCNITKTVIELAMFKNLAKPLSNKNQMRQLITLVLWIGFLCTRACILI